MALIEIQILTGCWEFELMLPITKDTNNLFKNSPYYVNLWVSPPQRDSTGLNQRPIKSSIMERNPILYQKNSLERGKKRITGEQLKI